MATIYDDGPKLNSPDLGLIYSGYTPVTAIEAAKKRGNYGGLVGNVGTKTNEEIALEVLRGRWGNGADRRKRLTDAGYNYSEILAIVNLNLSKSGSAASSTASAGNSARAGSANNSGATEKPSSVTSAITSAASNKSQLTPIRIINGLGTFTPINFTQNNSSLGLGITGGSSVKLLPELSQFETVENPVPKSSLVQKPVTLNPAVTADNLIPNVFDSRRAYNDYFVNLFITLNPGYRRVNNSRALVVNDNVPGSMLEISVPGGNYISGRLIWNNWLKANQYHVNNSDYSRVYDLNNNLVRSPEWANNVETTLLSRKIYNPTFYRKQGGTINYFQQGGAMQLDPVQQVIDALILNPQETVLQLVQLQKQNKQQVDAILQEIASRAKSGDTKARLALQALNPQKAEKGAKLNYINHLRGKCAEDEELVYLKKGGTMCPVCLKKKVEAAKDGGKKFFTEDKCGGKAKKKEDGGIVEFDKCGKKLKKASKGTNMPKDNTTSETKTTNANDSTKLKKTNNEWYKLVKTDPKTGNMSYTDKKGTTWTTSEGDVWTGKLGKYTIERYFSPEDSTLLYKFIMKKR